MSLFTSSELREAGLSASRIVSKSAYSILREDVASFSESKTYDIFLSYSSKDADETLGLKTIIEKLGYTVYVDWDDPNLDRSKVSPNTASLLKVRMKTCRSLFFATSENSPTSKWMPWELGYFDAFKGKVAILPIVQQPISTYTGQEYLGLYPYVEKADDREGKAVLWINKDASTYVRFEQWLQGKEPYKR